MPSSGLSKNFMVFLAGHLVFLALSCQTIPPAKTVEEARMENAHKFFTKAIKAEQEGATGAAILFYSCAIQNDPDMIEAYYRRANNHFDRFVDELAIADYTEVLRRNPDHKNARFNRAVSYMATGDVEKAHADFTELLRYDPHDKEVHKYMGIIHLDYLPQPEKASYHFSCYRELGGIDPQVEAWLSQLPKQTRDATKQAH